MAQSLDLQNHTAWLLCNDTEFLKQNAKVPPAVFPRGSLRYLVHLAVTNWEANRAVLSDTIITIAVQNDARGLKRNQTDGQDVVDTFQLLDTGWAVDQNDLVTVRKYCRSWLEKRVTVAAVDRAHDALSRDDFKTARALLDQSTLADDEQRHVLSFSAGSPDFLQAAKLVPPGAIPTGFKPLDDNWDGGYRPGHIGMIVAPTGVGKSMMLTFMAAQAFWEHADVLYYTFELTIQQIQERIALAVLEKGMRHVQKTWLEELQDAAKRRKQPMPQGSFDIRGGSMTWPELEADLEEYKMGRGKYPDVLLLDSADDIFPMNPQAAVHEQLKMAFTRLRSIAHQKNIRIWSTGQLNRDAIEKALVNLKQIGDSYAKAQRSHYVLAFTQTKLEREAQNGARMHMYVLKDSNYGTVGADFELKPSFGPGNPKEFGYPGFSVEKAEHLPS